MDNKIIEVFDCLGEKIGLAIDWTAENIYPQVIEFMGRYKIYVIMVDILWILAGLGCCFCMYLYIKQLVIPAKVRCKETKEDNFWYEYLSFSNRANIQINGIVLNTLLGFTTIAMFIMAITSLGDLIKWFVIPEMQFYEVIKSLIA